MTIWITGAGSGIGRALAMEYASVDTRLILSGRTEERLQETAELCRSRGAEVEILGMDLGDSESRARAISTIGNRPIDILINNAGISQREKTWNTEFSVDHYLMEVNYLAGVHLTKAVLPGMRERGFGRIVGVSSISGIAGAPLRSAYGASKAAQIIFYSSLHNELVGSGVSAHVVIAGFVRTDVSLHALRGDGNRHGKMDDIQSVGRSPEEAANQIRRGIEGGVLRIRTGLTPTVRLFFFLQRFFPRILDLMLQKNGAGE